MRDDSDAMLEDTHRITEIKSPSIDPASVNHVLDVIAGRPEGTFAICKRQKTDDRSGDILRVKSDPPRKGFTISISNGCPASATSSLGPA